MKLHTLLDLHGSIPVFVRVTDGKMHDVNLLDQIAPEPGAFYVMDRGYLDFERLCRLTQAAAFFVTRTKDNVLLQRRYSHRVDPATGVRSDHTVVPATPASAKHYPAARRRVRFFDAERRRFLVFLTNNFDLSALTVAYLYKARGRSSCSSSGSSSTCASRPSTASAPTPCALRCGSPSRCMCW